MIDMYDEMKERYKHSPLIIKRSVDYACNRGDLIRILDSVPNVFPIRWDDVNKKWATITQTEIINFFT